MKKELAPEIQYFVSVQTEVVGTLRPTPGSQKVLFLITERYHQGLRESFVSINRRSLTGRPGWFLTVQIITRRERGFVPVRRKKYFLFLFLDPSWVCYNFTMDFNFH
jgi:hypothetical protein